MRLRAITLNNVRRFTAPVRMTGIGDGLNLLCEPNEHGKSTLFDALQAVFFKPHGSRDKEVMALRPHAGGAPEVGVEIEIGDRCYTLSKRWLSKPTATVHEGGRLVAQADEAEAWIATQVGGDTGGPAGLVWVRQGMTGLESGSGKEDRAAFAARRDLMSSVGAEVEAMTGGRRMDLALHRTRGALAELVTSTGRPKKNGPWQDALDRAEALIARRDALRATADDLHAALEARRRARRALSGFEDPAAARDRQDRLDAARAAHREAERHAATLDTLASRVATAAAQADGARRQRDASHAALAEERTAAARVAEAEAEAEAAAAAHADARAARDAAEATLRQARDAHEAAEDADRRARRAQAARDGAAQRKDLDARIAAAETARQRMEAARAAAATGPDAKAMQHLEACAAAHGAALAARNATAPQLIVHYAPGRAGAIAQDGTPLPEATPVPIARAMRLTVDGVGTLDLRPGDTDGGDADAERAGAALRKALADASADTLDDARRAAAARAAAAQDLAVHKATFESVAPDGLEALRGKRAAIPEATDDDAPDPAEAEAALKATRAASNEAAARHEAAQQTVSDRRDADTRSATALQALRDRLARARDTLATFGEDPEPRLREALGTAETALEVAEAALAAARQAAPDLADATADLRRAETVVAQADSETARLRLELATLDERIRRAAGDAVEERLAETEDALAATQAEAGRFAHEVAVLTRLAEALDTARAEARERYFAPVAAHLRPLLALLWPDAELTWNADDILPAALVRDGAEEPISILSGGTQEQVALLVRLAFARMLAEAGRAAPVILDDALVFSDDDRIERMFVALNRQATDLQILVLTCRQRAFQNLGGRALHLAPA